MEEGCSVAEPSHDHWSFACTIHVLAAGTELWNHVSNEAEIKARLLSEDEIELQAYAIVDESIKNILKAMFIKRVDKRAALTMKVYVLKFVGFL